MLPLINRYHDHYRAPANSQEYNDLRDKLYFDITQLYNYATNNHTKIYRNMDIVLAENIFLQRHIITLEALVNDIQHSMADSANLKYLSHIYATTDNIYYELDDVNVSIPETNRMYIDTSHLVAQIPPTFTQSRIRSADIIGNEGIIVGLQMHVYEGTTTANLNTNISNGTRVDTPTGLYAFDGKRNTFWIQDSAHDAEDLYIMINIKLPQSHVINTLELHPFPYQAITLRDIEYKTPAGTWDTIPTYPVDTGTPDDIPHWHSSKFVFPGVHTDEFRIYVKQPYHYAGSPNNTFIYGFNHIDIQHQEFNTHEASFVSKFDISQYEGLAFSLIQTPRTTVDIGSVKNIDNLLDHSLYYEDDAGTIWPGSFNSTIPIGDNCKTIYILTRLRIRDNISPLIKSIQILFDTT